MGKLQVRYPFPNGGGDMFSNGLTMDCFFGENEIPNRYGSYSRSYSANASGGININYTPNFIKTVNPFKIYMSFSTATEGKLTLDRYQSSSSASAPYGDAKINSMFYYSAALGNGIYGRDYTKIPFYSYESESTYMFAIDKLSNFFLITERHRLDEHASKSCSIMTRKIAGETDSCPLGLYEYNDSSSHESAAKCTNRYTDTRLYNAHNVGYCSMYSLYQYTRDGYIYPDIYYCDGGLSVPPDGVVRIGTSTFMKLGSNLFLRID